jgi:hypothetical protein
MANIVAQTQKKVKSYLKAIYKKNYSYMVLEIDDTFIVRRGSAAVHVSVIPLNKEDCLVRALAYVVQGAKLTPKLLDYLMRLNVRHPVGAFGLIFDNTITYGHSINGAHLDQNELRTTVATVAYVADEMDDAIRKLAGGMRAVDANAAVIESAEEAEVRIAEEKKPARKLAKKPVAKPAAKSRK